MASNNFMEYRKARDVTLYRDEVAPASTSLSTLRTKILNMILQTSQLYSS